MGAYTIKSGDTLWDIAKSNNTTVDEIRKANPSIKNPDVIHPGQSIEIPTATNNSQANNTSATNKNTQTTTPTQTKPDNASQLFEYSDYSSYDASTNAAYQEALAALKAAQSTIPTYKGTYDAQLEEVYNQIVNREKFSYDLNSDALYNQYKDQYATLGKMASMDTMGQAAALTGGYGNSYASTAGNQAYQAYLQQLNDVVPELYGMALDQYNQEGKDLLAQYDMLGDMADTEYGRYQDELANYWQNIGYLSDKANTEYDRGLNLWATDYQNKYQAERDKISDSRWQTEWDEAIRQYNEQMAYQKERDAVADAQWQKQYDESVRQYNTSLAAKQKEEEEEEEEDNDGGNDNKGWFDYSEEEHNKQVSNKGGSYYKTVLADLKEMKDAGKSNSDVSSYLTELVGNSVISRSEYLTLYNKYRDNKLS